MAHFVGKIILNNLIGFRIADVWNEDEMKDEKCIVIPIKDNDIHKWGTEWQYWFRAMSYHSTTSSKFSHFIMKYIPIKDVKRMSASQLEAFANKRIGAMYRSDQHQDKIQDENNSEDFVSSNI